jgi:tRNA-2-methylthio-N6-dimethylallyladenosine synthase
MGETYYIETYGCQMNEHDSEKMAFLLEELGLIPATTPDAADVVIINTCSIREKAEHKVYSALGTLKSLKTRSPRTVTIVAGCVAQQEKAKLLKRAAHLDAVIGTHHISELPAVLERIRHHERVTLTEFVKSTESLHMQAPHKGKSPVCSYVTIMQGCSNYCSYCVVPYTRGPEISRPAQDIVTEVRKLVEHGVKEVTLLGQNVNAYGKDLEGIASFGDLLRRLDGISGLERIRFTTSHPKDFTFDLVDAMAELSSVCEHVHLPLQSGSDRILSAMRRGYTREQYLEVIRGLRGRIPGVAITADMIVGFPGETAEDFQQTLAALEEIRFDQIFSFKYSARPGTAARRLPGHVADEDKSERLAQVHALQDRITEQYHKAAEETEVEVLIEGFRPQSGQPFGRARTNRIVNLEAADGAAVGELVQVRVVRGLKHSLVGKRVGIRCSRA